MEAGKACLCLCVDLRVRACVRACLRAGVRVGWRPFFPILGPGIYRYRHAEDGLGASLSDSRMQQADADVQARRNRAWRYVSAAARSQRRSLAQCTPHQELCLRGPEYVAPVQIPEHASMDPVGAPAGSYWAVASRGRGTIRDGRSPICAEATAHDHVAQCLRSQRAPLWAQNTVVARRGQ